MAFENGERNGKAGVLKICGRRRSFLERRRIGRRDYYLLERIGSPFRERYLAFDPENGPGGDFFLVQVWPAGRDCQQKLQVFRRLKDDSFPRVVEWRRHSTTVEAVLTWTEGIPLSQYLQNIREGRRPPVNPGQSIRLIYGLAAAVAKLHHKLQVAHGDIQPANIIITNHPSRLMLIDFGSAWSMQATASRSEGDGHHPCYSAPELQAGAIPVGFFADQFSVSVLLFELLTQQLPYGGLGGKAGRPEFIHRTHDALVAPSRIDKTCRALPRSLRQRIDQLTLRGLSLDPHDRYPDRHAWLDELYEASVRFRLPSELPPLENALTQVLHWFLKPWAGQKLHDG